MCSCLVHGIVIVQQFHLNKGYSSSYYCSTAGGARAVHGTRKYRKVYPYFNTSRTSTLVNLTKNLSGIVLFRHFVDLPRDSLETPYENEV